MTGTTLVKHVHQFTLIIEAQLYTDESTVTVTSFVLMPQFVIAKTNAHEMMMETEFEKSTSTELKECGQM